MHLVPVLTFSLYNLRLQKFSSHKFILYMGNILRTRKILNCSSYIYQLWILFTNVKISHATRTRISVFVSLLKSQ